MWAEYSSRYFQTLVFLLLPSMEVGRSVRLVEVVLRSRLYLRGQTESGLGAGPEHLAEKKVGFRSARCHHNR